jgi:hypothetical protein
MFEDNPAKRQRAIGLAALAAIGFGGAMAVDLIVTGGFDFGSPAPYDREQPSAYVRVVDAAAYVGDSFRSIGWDDAFALRPPDTSASEARLAGEDDGAPPPDMFAETTGEDLYSEIAALYADSEDGYRDEPTYEDAPALDAEDAEPAYEDEAYEEPLYEEPLYEEENSGPNEAEASVYETASPW